MANTHVGSNIQNINTNLKTMFTAGDPRFGMGNADLSGADNWTVALHSARLGDPTMIEDLEFGLKPAWNLLVGYFDGVDAMFQERPALRLRGKELQEEKPKMYIGSKGGVNGSNYLMKPATGVENILNKTRGKVLITQQEFAELQRLYFIRYNGVKLWHEDVKMRLLKDGYIRSADGHKRIFFGRKSDEATLRVALSQEPQANTGRATMRAKWKLFYEDFNRDGNGDMIIRPLNTVHDSIVFWYKKQYEGMLKSILDNAFDNVLTIAGREIVINYEWDKGDCWPKG